jgi:hypothetical protein
MLAESHDEEQIIARVAALAQGIGRVNAPGLRAGVTGAGSEPATYG